MARDLKTRRLKWILTSTWGLLLCPLTAAGAISSLPNAISFYRSQDAAFASGQASRASLEKNKLRSEFELVHQVRWNHHIYNLKADELLQDVNCATKAELTTNSLLLEEDRNDSAQKFELAKGAEVTILQIRSNWAQVKAANGRQGWLPLQRLSTVNLDRGVFISIIDTFLKDKPSAQGHIITTLPKGQRVQPIDFAKDGWIQISLDGHTGYVDGHHLVGRADFANWAWNSKTKSWLIVDHREGNFVKGPKSLSLSLKDIGAFTSDPEKAIVVQGERTDLPPRRAHAEIIKTDATVWAVSRIEGHGDVWWKQKSLFTAESLDGSESLNTEELLKRDVFSYAFTGTKKLEGLVSAKGIWKTKDGIRWHKISEFGDQDLPVAIHSQGLWFVGSSKSSDQGQTFEPFIRWDSLTRTIEATLHRSPRYVKIQKIEPLGEHTVQIQVDTGIRRLTLRSSLDSLTWQLQAL